MRCFVEECKNVHLNVHHNCATAHEKIYIIFEERRGKNPDDIELRKYEPHVTAIIHRAGRTRGLSRRVCVQGLYDVRKETDNVKSTYS